MGSRKIMSFTDYMFFLGDNGGSEALFTFLHNDQKLEL